jgi:circadian clock protein KaiC
MGPAGAGKTTICSQYLIAALNRGENVSCYLFEESPDTFLKRADGLGMNFRPHLQSGLFNLVQADLAVLSPGEFSSRVRQAVEKRNATIIVIDSLNGYLNGMPSERFLLIHMHELLTYLGQKGVATILTLAQHGVVGGTMHAPIDLSFLADTVILLRYFEAGGLVRQAVSIVKKRRSGHERSIREMKITSGGLRVGEVLKNFRGVLTGVPEYRGKSEELLDDKTEQ